jgi:hyperosmotically inducible protein
MVTNGFGVCGERGGKSMKTVKTITLGLMVMVLPLLIGCGPTTGKPPPPPQPVSTPTGVETPQDAALSKTVKEKLLADKSVNLSPVTVETRKGTVYLTGRVASLDAREHAAKIAWQVPGVQTVLNHLQVGD